jgi:signal transduction histidine kinase
MMDALYRFELFEGLPEAELRWLLENSTEEHLDKGAFFFKENGPAERFYIVLEGELQVTRLIDGQEVVLGTTPRGIMGGELSLLYGTPSNVTSCAIVPSRLLVLDKQAFRESFSACPTFGARVFQTAIERTQGLAINIKQQEKMAALGKLAAGLAHEMNNPAAAARRAARTLSEALPELQAETIKLSALNLTEVQLQSLVAFQRDAVENAALAPPLSPLEQSDREDALGDWLEARGIADGWKMVTNFVAADVTLEEIEELAGQLAPDSLEMMLSWLNSALYAAGLLNEIEQSTRRISDLVTAVKGYTYMDQAPVQEVDIHQGLENTLTVMRHKLKNITIVREYEPELPKIRARGGELNQVWTNLIDNAIDAVDGEGTLSLITRQENAFVMVEVADDGPGIEPEAQARLFEPFYTTKEVGIGTGLGLDISYRIIRQHNGTVEVQSKPGHTRFIVRLPIGANGTPDE